ncbi:DUF5694 domain-containing protein [Cytophagaceae bacterium YF14B1]|uniref:DUF5694 domain-containing protein n=1 Tax=Xanthocytophaga flava TaxID=3048013 RepID=A0AAE3QUN3_9BACT|nr:DUF5694 domain-containing protein [Xanthocytophaga flavus]MDJ1483084.1 DUF5694 domain-containing protein [Xanthocytophaga flavus]
MKSFFVPISYFLPLCFLPVFASAQTNTDKIKVYLLGTFHFGKTSDKHSTSFPDLNSPKRQKELDQIADAINRAGVSKIFVERSYFLQTALDSLGELYINNKPMDSLEKRNEIYQVAYRAKRKNRAIQVVATDRKMELPYDDLDEYESMNPDSKFGGAFFKESYIVKQKRLKLNESTLQEYYLSINSEASRKSSQADFLHYALSYGDKSDFTGTKFTTSWYERNLIIFTNILRHLDPKTDASIVVLYGSSHTAVLRQFFENHDRFQIVELEKLFGEALK